VAADGLLPGASWPRLRYPRDTHWNAAGHEAVGKALAPRIRPLLTAQ
jgi:lysophospholipase L1-like esterase